MKKLFIFIIPLFAILVMLAPTNINAKSPGQKTSNANTFFKDLQTKYNKKSADCKNPSKSKGIFGSFDLSCVSYMEGDLLDFTKDATGKYKDQSLMGGIRGLSAWLFIPGYLVAVAVVVWGGISFHKASFTGSDPSSAKTKIIIGISGFLIILFAHFIVSSWTNIGSLIS